MKILYFLSDYVFRFKYENHVFENDGKTVWDIGIYEDASEKALKEFFIMGFICASILCIIAGMILWLA